MLPVSLKTREEEPEPEPAAAPSLSRPVGLHHPHFFALWKDDSQFSFSVKTGFLREIFQLFTPF